MTLDLLHAGRVRRLVKHSTIRTALKRGEITEAKARLTRWFLRLEIDGREIYFKLPVNDRDALSAARDILNGRASHPKTFTEFLAAQRHKPLAPTLAEYLHLYERTPTGESSDKSRHAAALALRRLLPDTLRLNALVPALDAAQARHAGALDAEPVQARKSSLMRSFNSTLAAASAVFRPKALRLIRPHLPTLPEDMSAFHEAARACRYKIAGNSIQRHAPDPQLLADTFEAWQQLPRAEFLATGLALTFGLRAGELVQVPWGWLRADGDYHTLDNRGADVAVKNKSSRLCVTALNPFSSFFHARIEREGWRGAAEDFILPQGRDALSRSVSEWLRGLGWQTRLHLHALRAWSVSLVFMRYGPVAARNFCRHASVTTTESHYAWLVEDKPFEPDLVTACGHPVSWHRTAKAEFNPVILRATA